MLCDISIQVNTNYESKLKQKMSHNKMPWNYTDPVPLSSGA